MVVCLNLECPYKAGARVELRCVQRQEQQVLLVCFFSLNLNIAHYYRGKVCSPTAARLSMKLSVILPHCLQ